MSIFKKSVSKPEPKSSDPLISYPVDVRFWKIHYDGISNLLKDAGIDLNDMRASANFKCKLIPDPTNEADPDCIRVYAAIKGRGTTWHDVGFVPVPETMYIGSDIKKVNAGTHYWSLSLFFDLNEGLNLSIYLKESKFNR